MSIGDQLREYAAQIAEQNQERQAGLEREILDLETKAAQKKALVDALRFGPQRLLDFQFKLGADYQCPRCWINHEKRSALTPIGGGTNTEDFFRCHTCGNTFSVSIR